MSEPKVYLLRGGSEFAERLDPDGHDLHEPYGRPFRVAHSPVDGPWPVVDSDEMLICFCPTEHGAAIIAAALNGEVEVDPADPLPTPDLDDTDPREEDET